MRRHGAALVTSAILLAACGSGDASSTGGAGGNLPSTSGSGGSLDPAQSAYPDLTSLHAAGVARTCSLNQGVCHAQREWPELGSVADLVAAVGAPCQIGAQDPASTLDACEVPGDRLQIGGKDLEILRVEIADDQPFPPHEVTIKIPALPPSLDASSARIHRSDAKGVDVLSKPLAGATMSGGADVVHIVIALDGATDPTLAEFLDVRAWHGDRVRQGDANGNGMAHPSAAPWAEIVPGDPSRSFLYQRLLSETYGPRMPLIPRTWSPTATRALWCWIRGLPKDATASTIDPTAPIDYASCPLDPDAPDPNATGGWPAVKVLFQGKCATGPCHSATAKAESLDLTPDPATFAKDVINAPATQSPGVLRVVPGQPAASYLLCKVDPKCASRAPDTELMPQGASQLSATEIQTISDWIQAGAPTK
ncbi:Hypothetical protein A7982_11269 [Minicystis rosea]|nr:Hypothetical protein A7982_11269 [Minicystis rosea]